VSSTIDLRINPAHLQRLLVGLTIVAVVAGVFARVKGLAAASLAADEYYLLRSADNVAQSGIPMYPCGGYYTRALLLQYPIAALRLLGLGPELAVRLPAVLAGLLALPAVWLLGLRVQGRTVALLAVGWLAVSIWEVELSRYGRMYAPFQTIFLWYLLYFLRSTVDGDRHAYYAMLVLTVVAALVWEGGVVLACANFLPFLLRPGTTDSRRSDLRKMLVAAVVLALTTWIALADFRRIDGNALPDNYYASEAAVEDVSAVAAYPADALGVINPGWTLAFVLSLVLSIWAVICVAKAGLPRLTVVAVGGAVFTAALQQFPAAALLIFLLLLLGRLTSREIVDPRLRWAWIALGASIVFWSAFTAGAELPNEELWPYRPADFLAFLYDLFPYPDVVDVVLRPLAGAVPRLTFVVVALLGLNVYQVVSRPEAARAQRLLTILLVCLVALVGLSDPPRYETRYSFFLYPLAVVLSLTAVARATERYFTAGSAGAVLTLAALLAFAVTEDWDPRHLRRVDDPAVIAGEGMRRHYAAHLVRRADIRSLGRWLDGRATHADTVISGIAGLDYYYPDIDYMYVDLGNSRFEDWSCRRGTVERWTNLPMLSTQEAVQDRVVRSPQSFLVLYKAACERLQPSLAAGQPMQVTRVAWRNANVCVLESEPGR
jgi:hypothetical protein